MWYLAKIIIWVILIWGLAWVLSFIPNFLWIIMQVFTFPVQLFRQFIYPVGPIVDAIWIWWSVLTVALSLLAIAHKHL